MRLFGLVGLALVATLALPMGPAVADAAVGEDAYDQLCQACHQAGGVGLPGAFPPLAGNPAIDDDSYVADVLMNGLQGEIVVLGETYNGNMPAFPQLSEDDVEDLIEYLRTLGSTITPDASTTTTAPSAAAVGDVAAGEALFLGSVRLSNGGPACFSCHSAGSHGGAVFGPDLSGAGARLGGAVGLTGWLSAPPSPTMQPLFAARPLAETEIADVVAYLESTTTILPDRGVDWMLLGGLGGLAGLFGVMSLFFKRPRGAYVDRLRSRA